jgi:NTP pyrophosphatase (non-canonical NTP hydrolase)
VFGFEHYQTAAGLTITPDQDNEDRKVNAALGLAGEAGEVVELIKKAMFHGKPYTAEQIKSELGDVLWYLNQMAYAHGLTLAEIAQANADKLRARYPNGFVKGGGVRSCNICEGKGGGWCPGCKR